MRRRQQQHRSSAGHEQSSSQPQSVASRGRSAGISRLIGADVVTVEPCGVVLVEVPVGLASSSKDFSLQNEDRPRTETTRPTAPSTYGSTELEGFTSAVVATPAPRRGSLWRFGIRQGHSDRENGLFGSPAAMTTVSLCSSWPGALTTRRVLAWIDRKRGPDADVAKLDAVT